MNFFKKFPDTMMIVLGVLLFFIVLTWIIPSGEYERRIENNREIVVPGTYQEVDPEPQPLWVFLTAPLLGFIEAAEIIGFVLFVGGAFAIVNRTGAIAAGLNSVIQWSMRNPKYKIAVVPVLMFLFSLAGATFGMSEEVLVFIMITIPLALALGYDSIVGVAIPFVGAGAGFAGAFSNPFTVGIAQGIAELPPFSGIEYRLIVWVIFTLIAILFVTWYALRVEKNKERSYVYEIDKLRDKDEFDQGQGSEELTSRRILVLLSLLLAIVGLIVGAIYYGWYIVEISALFVSLGIVAALIYGLSFKDAISAFESGAKDMLIAAIIIGISRGMLVVASDGKIIDTMMFYIASTTDDFPAAVSVQFMFIFQSMLNFFIPSGSGQAALTMPLMAPLSDLIGISRQTAVLAYQFGDGISNLIIPTSGIVMGILSIAKIPYHKWLKFMLPLIIIMSIVAMLLLIPPVTFFEYN